MNIIYAILGIIGGLLCACGDILFDFKGKGNIESGKKIKFINSNWDKMPPWRFKLSIVFCALGAPLAVLCGIMIANTVAVSSPLMGNLLLIAFVVGGSGGVFIHISLCVVPLLYLKAKSLANADVAEEIINEKWNAIKVPFLVMYLIFIGVTPLLVIISICLQYLTVPMWCVVLNPLVFAIVGVTLRRVCNKIFYELPGIIMPSMGLAMYGVLALISIL